MFRCIKHFFLCALISSLYEGKRKNFYWCSFQFLFMFIFIIKSWIKKNIRFLCKKENFEYISESYKPTSCYTKFKKRKNRYDFKNDIKKLFPGPWTWKKSRIVWRQIKYLLVLLVVLKKKLIYIILRIL